MDGGHHEEGSSQSTEGDERIEATTDRLLVVRGTDPAELEYREGAHATDPTA